MKLRITKLPNSVKRTTQGIKNREIVLGYIANSSTRGFRWGDGKDNFVTVQYNPISRHYEVEGNEYPAKYVISLINILSD